MSTYVNFLYEIVTFAAHGRINFDGFHIRNDKMFGVRTYCVNLILVLI